jgi:hypothetical protein
LISSSDKNASDALDKAFSVATGDVYGYINADDTLAPGRFTCGCILRHQH